MISGKDGDEKHKQYKFVQNKLNERISHLCKAHWQWEMFAPVQPYHGSREREI